MRTLNFQKYIFSTVGVILNVPLAFPNSTESNNTKEYKSLPNIILIVADDQGYNDLGVYGNDEIITPNLDQLAKEGVRFTDFYVTSPASTPSRGSLLTGRYPQRNGTYELFRNDRVNDKHVYTSYEYSVSPEKVLGMDNREILMPELLKKKNYVSGIFGKWDLGQLKRFLPLQRGFDEYYGFSNTGIDYYTHERYFVPSMYRNNEQTEIDKGTYSTYLFEREAVRFINENKKNPFFLYLPFNAPHSASNWDVGGTQAPKEYIDMYPENMPKKKREYWASITCMDNSIGNIVKLIDDLNLTENTIVIFLSDNGGGSAQYNFPLNGSKATMWEGGIRVPCIIKWPKRIEKGRVVQNFVSTLELLPTILEITKICVPEDVVLDGFSIMPLLDGRNNKLERQDMFWEFREEYAARVGNWKWLKSDRKENNNGFFNLITDISERKDLTSNDNVELKKVVDEFSHWQEEMKNAEPRGPFKDF